MHTKGENKNKNHDEQGNPNSDAQTIRDLVDQAILADKLGLDHFNVGEHHRDDFSVSAPDTVLAGIATVTKNIKLGSGVTVLSSEDPVRVYQRFATLDALSNGRAEITAGRGSFTESFPLFGYELSDYHVLFEEKLDLLEQLPREFSRAGKLLRQMLPHAFRAHRQILGSEGIWLHDVVALVAATNPELFERVTVAADVETAGEITSGMLVVDRRQNRSARPNLDLLVGCDATAVTDCILRGFAAAADAT